MLAFGLAACGGGDDGSLSADEVRERQAEADAEVRKRNERLRQRAAGPTAEEKEAARVTESFYGVLGKDIGGKRRTTVDSKSFCGLMSEEARQDTIDYARRLTGEAKDWKCKEAITVLILRSKQTGGFKRAQSAKVIGVNAEGDRATASVRFGKGPITSIALVREDGEWKLGSSPTG